MAIRLGTRTRQAGGEFQVPKSQSLPEGYTIRHLVRDELPLLEWEGEYIHFRRVFKRAYQNARRGRAVLWVAVAPPRRMLGQVFVMLRSARPQIADGVSRAYLHSIRVRLAYRNMGLGAIMLQFTENDLIDRGFKTALLNVARDNPNALRFYTRHGYQIVGPDPGCWWYLDHRGRRRDVVEPSWRMEKELLA